MEAEGRVLYEIPVPMVRRAQRRFKVARALGLASAAFVLVLPITSSLRFLGADLLPTYFILGPAWGAGVFMTYASHRLVKAYNGLAFTEEGYYPAFRLPGTPRGRRTFLPVDDMERVSVDGGVEDFTAAVALWSGKGVILTSSDLLRYFRNPVRGEFPRILGAFSELQALVASTSGVGRGTSRRRP